MEVFLIIVSALFFVGILLSPIALSCNDHEGGGQLRIQQWDGEKWSFVSDWIEPNRDGFLRDMYEASAAQYAEQNGLTPRECGS